MTTTTTPSIAPGRPGTTLPADAPTGASVRAGASHGAGAATGRRQRRYSGLDGLRAIAVMAVIVYHVFPRLLPGGFIGVDIFFVISGFLITSLLVSERTATGRVDLRRFWSRRARRLVPALVALILVTASAAWAVGGDVLVGIGRQIMAALTFSSNWVDLASNSSYFSHSDPGLFRNLWSLAVEEQFYLLWPLLILAIMLIRHRGARLGIVYVIAVASAVEMAMLYQPHTDATRVYFGSDTHCFGLALGAALALLIERLKPLDLDLGETAMQYFVRRWLPTVGVLSLIGLALAALWLHDDSAATYHWGLFVVSVLSAFVIWAAVSGASRSAARRPEEPEGQPSTFGRVLDNRPLRYIGERSYGLYLWHWPIFVVVIAAMPVASQTNATALQGALTLAITATVAVVSYRFLERPIRVHGVGGCARALASRLRPTRGNRLVVVALVLVPALLLAGTAGAVVFAPATTRAQADVERGRAAIAAQRVRSAKDAATAGGGSAASGGGGANSGHPGQTGSSGTDSAQSNPATGAAGASTSAGQTGASTGVSDQVATGEQITAIGDSVMLASAPALEESFPGISIDAVVSRQMYTAAGILQSLKSAGQLRRVVLVGMGTNGSISLNDLNQIQSIAGPERQLVFVTVEAPRGWTDGVNAALRAFAAAHPRSVGLADWQSAIAPHLDLLAPDQIHPGMSGGRIYASVVGEALRGLAQRSTYTPRQVTWH